MGHAIVVKENYLPLDVYHGYREFATTTSLYDNFKTNDVWNQRIIYANQVKELYDLNRLYVSFVSNTIRTEYALEVPVYTDILCFNRWRVGDMQHPHADGEQLDGSLHPFHWRKYGCILYLNDDYEGGEIYFPNQSVELKPRRNTLVFFPGTTEYLHGVRPITKGTRYTISTFWTFDFGHSLIL